MGKNATNLFEKSVRERKRKFYNSESWWTAFFTMLALWSDKEKIPLNLPWYGSNQAVDDHISNGYVSFRGISYQNMAADAKLKGDLFNLADWPPEFLDLRPDMTFIKSENEKEVIFIETKTIGTTVQKNIQLYARLISHLGTEGWNAEMYYLLSKGHETKRDWQEMENASARFIIWEDVFVKANDSPFGELFFPESLIDFVE